MGLRQTGCAARLQPGARALPTTRPAGSQVSRHCWSVCALLGLSRMSSKPRPSRKELQLNPGRCTRPREHANAHAPARSVESAGCCSGPPAWAPAGPSESGRSRSRRRLNTLRRRAATPMPSRPARRACCASRPEAKGGSRPPGSAGLLRLARRGPKSLAGTGESRRARWIDRVQFRRRPKQSLPTSAKSLEGQRFACLSPGVCTRPHTARAIVGPPSPHEQT